MKKKNEFCKRIFLNKKGHHSVAFLHIKGKKDKEEDTASIVITIGDCNRIISLDLSYYKKGDKANALSKLNKLLTNLTELREFIEPTKE